MPASVRDQLTVCASLTELEKHIAKAQIPREYGGESPFALGEAEEERGLRALVEANNAAAPEAAAAGAGGGGGGGEGTSSSSSS